MFDISEPIITSLIIIGIYYATSYVIDSNGNPTEKNAIWFVRYYVDKWCVEWIAKPIITCPKCMSSVWGVIAYFLLFRHGIDDLYYVVPFVCAVSAINNLFYKILEW